MTDSTGNLRHLVKIEVNRILLNSTLADDGIEPSDKISDLITFPGDIRIIKERFQNCFGVRLNSDISDTTVNHLYTKAFVVVVNSERVRNRLLNRLKDYQPKKQKEQIQPVTPVKSNTNPKWNRRTIFSYIIKNIGNTVGRTVQSDEKIADLLLEVGAMKKNYEALVYKIQELEKFFDIKINQGMRIYNIGNAAERSFVVQGKAEDSRTKYESMDPLWAVIHRTLPMKYLQSLLLNELKVRISVYKLLNVASYAELEKLVSTAKKINEQEH